MMWKIWHDTTCWCWIIVVVMGISGCNPFGITGKAAAFFTVPYTRLVYGNDTLTDIIPDVWAYAYPDYVGTFQTPVRFPLLKSATQELILAAGVWTNGNLDIRSQYPFMRFWRDTMTVIPGEHHTIIPTFVYSPDTLLNFHINEDFEGQDVKFQAWRTGKDSAFIQTITGDKFTGQACGLIQFDSIRKTFAVINTNNLRFPRDGRDIWLEVAYKGEIKFAAALIYRTATDERTSELLLPTAPYTSNRWQLVCFNFTAFIAGAPKEAVFRLYLTTSSDGQKRRLFLDNIRFIHFRN